ncbi:hypothetical protein NQ318_000661, partial [Aromia moschata]
MNLVGSVKFSRQRRYFEGVRPSEILTRLQAVFGDETLCKTQVYEWHTRSSAGRERVENEPHDRRPRTSFTEENICAV